MKLSLGDLSCYLRIRLSGDDVLTCTESPGVPRSDVQYRFFSFINIRFLELLCQHSIRLELVTVIRGVG